jgi:hypothetical protein
LFEVRRESEQSPFQVLTIGANNAPMSQQGAKASSRFTQRANEHIMCHVGALIQFIGIRIFL